MYGIDIDIVCGKPDLDILSQPLTVSKPRFDLDV